MDEDHAYIVMEYVGGGTLHRFARADNLLNLGDVIEVVYKCSRALDFASQQGVIHRDIKPANILIKNDTDIKISDFGAAASTLTTTRTRGGRHRHAGLHVAGAAPEPEADRPDRHLRAGRRDVPAA